MGLKVGLSPLLLNLVQNLVFVLLIRQESIYDWLDRVYLHQVFSDTKQATFEASRFRLNN
jgi:hypothetical protein